MAVNSPQPTQYFLFCHESVYPITSMKMAMVYLTLHTRVLSSWLRTYLLLMNTIMVPVTSMMMQKAV